MNARLSIHCHELSETVDALCRRTGLVPGEVATILAEIHNDDIAGFRRQTLADALPAVYGAYLQGGYAACAAPDIWMRLVRTCVASFCLIHGLAPSQLARTAHGMANTWPPAAVHTPEQAAAMMFELDEHAIWKVQVREA